MATAAPTMTSEKRYAFSALTITKAEDDGRRRIFTGTATTPTPDRAGDVVEPKGAEFKLPIALLWQHNSREPIGWVRQAKVGAAGIEVTCEVARENAPGRLKDRLDEAWQSLVGKLVCGLSIGFKPIEYSQIDQTYSYRFMKWLWLELSTVTIPMNGDCTVEAIKSADEAFRRAAFGDRSVIRLDPLLARRAGDSSRRLGTETRRPGAVYLPTPSKG